MIWLTFRQFRAAAAMMAGALAVLALVLGLTHAGLADAYSSGIAACTAEGGGCSQFFRDFFDAHQGAFLAVTLIVLVLPPLLGLFWGAPLIARELETGTHRLVWNQTITRTRWLAVKLGLVGVATMAAAGLGSLVVSWWARALDKSAASDFPRMAPLVFDARGIAPVGYAAFAFAVGVTVGMLVRRTVPAMAVTLAVFVGAQIAMPLLVRPHLIPPAHATIPVSAANLDKIALAAVPGGSGTGGRARLAAPDPGTGTGRFAGAWILSSQTLDPAGHVVDSIPVPQSAACAPPDPGAKPGPMPLAACIGELARRGYKQRVTYQPASRYWAFQAFETAIFIGVALLLTGFCFRWLRHRLS